MKCPECGAELFETYIEEEKITLVWCPKCEFKTKVKEGMNFET